MKAEIGFAAGRDLDGRGRLTDRLEVVITAETATEATLLDVFARRLGRPWDGWSMSIQEPAPGPTASPAPAEPR
jgi:hypothetical protein